MQRLRITFARGEATKYLSHLEMMRLWERVFRRAGWRLAYSQGFNPHPKMFFAAPLAVGVASDAELLEVFLDEARRMDLARTELSERMPDGTSVSEVREIAFDAPPLQRLLTAAQYEALLPEDAAIDALRGEAERMLGAGSLPRTRVKDKKSLSYDLRPMLRALSIDMDGNTPVVWMELRTDAQGAGRPDEVLRELGLDPMRCGIKRTKLLFGSGAAIGSRRVG